MFLNQPFGRIADLNAIFPFLKSIHPNHFRQYLPKKEDSTGRKAQEIYRTTNAADLQNTLREQSVQEDTKTPQHDILSTLIGKLKLSLEEALMRLMG